MVLYLLVCLTSVLAGCGILTLLGVVVDRSSTLALSPLVTLCSVTVLMGGLVAGGFTLAQMAPLIILLCLGAAAFGMVRHGNMIRRSWLSLSILMILPLLLLRPLLHAGFANYLGGNGMDGWGYVTGGQTLQQYSLGTEGWLPLQAQYSSQFQKASRFISYGFLGLLAPLSGAQSDTQDVFGRYVGWLLFVYGATCSFFAKAALLKRPLAWTFVFLAVLSGWTLRLISANNVDNTLAISFLPAVLGILMMMPAPSLPYGILLGGIVSAGLYDYPESVPFTLAAILAVVVQKIIANPDSIRIARDYRRMGTVFLITIAVCVSPYFLEIVAFYRLQLMLGTQPIGTRPGESLYSSLLNPRYALPNFWGLTPDFWFNKYSGSIDPYATAMAWILTIAALTGLLLLVRRGHWGVPLFVVGMTAAYVFCATRLHYSYAVSKFGVLERFASVFLVVVGLEWIFQLVSRLSPRWAYAFSGLGLFLLAVMSGFFLLEQKIFTKTLLFRSVQEFRKVSALEHLARDLPIAMVVRETYANMWATHFLRDTKLYVAGQYRGYMAASPSMPRAERVDSSDIRYVVTDSETTFSKEFLLSQEGPYYIWDLKQAPWAFITEVDNSAGVPVTESSLWITKADSELQIVSRSATAAHIRGDFSIADALPAQTHQRVHITNTMGWAKDIVLSSGSNSFCLPLQPGLNKLLIRSTEKEPLTIHSEHVFVASPPSHAEDQILNCEDLNGTNAPGDDGRSQLPTTAILKR